MKLLCVGTVADNDNAKHSRKRSNSFDVRTLVAANKRRLPHCATNAGNNTWKRSKRSASPHASSSNRQWSQLSTNGDHHAAADSRCCFQRIATKNCVIETVPLPPDDHGKSAAIAMPAAAHITSQCISVLIENLPEPSEQHFHVTDERPHTINGYHQNLIKTTNGHSDTDGGMHTSLSVLSIYYNNGLYRFGGRLDWLSP